MADDIDIVERLREYAHIVELARYDDGELLEEAADEIERLRAERDALRFDNAELLDGLESKHDYACRMDALAEERLMQVTRLWLAGDALAEALTLPFALSSTAARDAWAAWQEARRG